MYVAQFTVDNNDVNILIILINARTICKSTLKNVKKYYDLTMDVCK